MEPVSDLPRTAAVIPAAGRGLRMGGNRKQFRFLGDAPLLVQTARVFVRHPRVNLVVLVAPPEDVGQVQSLASNHLGGGNVRVVPGGETRTASVRAGLDAVPSDVHVVLVHDAVRPFVTPALIDAVLDAALAHGASAPALPVSDTLRQVEDGHFGTTLDRSRTVRVQTPQGFQRQLLDRAFSRVSGDTGATDDAELVLSHGHPVYAVPGSSSNMKLTTEDDWSMAVMLWSSWIASQSEART